MSKQQAGARPAVGPSGAMRPVEMLRWVWTQLTSMRTALALLFLLALGAIPGSLIPQTAASAMKVTAFAKDHPLLDKIYGPLGMYHVYTSPWFSAIYLLLFVSLIGCIIPRVRVYARAVRGRPPRVPARLDRLPEHRSAIVADPEAAQEGVADPEAAQEGVADPDSDPDAALERAEAWLRARHFRVDRTGDALSAERGYLREFGNLLFHLSMVALLIGVGWNNLMSFKGTTVIVEGAGFSNSITQYDDYHAGAWVNTDKLAPFTLDLKKFTVRFETGAVQRGAAREFNALVDLTADGRTRTTNIQVNHPLTVDGNKIHLLGHGYAAHVTVTDGKGQVAYAGPVVFLPTDGNFTSSGVIKVPDARPDALYFQGLFLPSAPATGMQGRSIFPDALNPKLALNAWYGAPRKETGLPENIYALDTTGLKQFTTTVKGKQDILRFLLAPGEGYTLPDGKGSIVFDGWSRWSKIQISSAPGLPMVMGSIAFAVLGLCLSLFIRPRRLWVRLRRDEGGATLVECAGLDRADARTGLAEQVDELLVAATGRAPEGGASNPRPATAPTPSTPGTAAPTTPAADAAPSKEKQ